MLAHSQRPLRLQRKLVPRSTSISSTGALRQAHLLLRGRCRPTVTSQAFMLGCGTEKMLLSRGNNVYPVAAPNSSQVSNGILLAQGVSEKEAVLQRLAFDSRDAAAAEPPDIRRSDRSRRWAERHSRCRGQKTH